MPCGGQQAAPHRGDKEDPLEQFGLILSPRQSVRSYLCVALTPRMIPKKGLSGNHIIAPDALVQVGKGSVTKGFSENQERHPKCFPEPSLGHCDLHYRPLR